MPKIGLISDTHNYLDPQAPALFAGVEHIVHAGDVGLPAVLRELERIAPVTAVNGNTDVGLPCRDTEVVELCGKKFLVQHIVDPHRLTEAVRRRIRREAPAVVVFGHTHQPFAERIDGVWFLNPGSAGKPRFGQPRTAAVLHIEPDNLRVEFHELRDPRPA
ncbi:MAG: metallophosphoesterase family protein [Verrucomicrobia bacterium]|nr:metallophosphoesterase family protein [Verrucomicrobiota bacterium]